MAAKPSIPQGTRDFSPAEVRRRNHILGILREIFERYGFQPLETPAMENLVTLTGKYGEEGDRLIFKVLNNGLHEQQEQKKAQLREEWEKLLDRPYATPVVTERALRYDLTIPFARYVVMHQHELAFPFRRYQMQPVWRADRPQKGRYREFWQCDCDVVGSNSLISEAELLCIYQEAFGKLGIPQVTVRINSRKILAGMAEVCGAGDRMMEMTIALDKIDKIGWDGVKEELQQRGIGAEAAEKLKQIIAISGSNEAQLDRLGEFMQDSSVGKEGIREIRETLDFHRALSSSSAGADIKLDISLARGLNYYTGVIVEVVCGAVKMGSIGGGGRYDDLTGLFGLKGLSGVGVSFGIDRIYDVMLELDLFPKALAGGAGVMLVHPGEEPDYVFGILSRVRGAGIACEIYPDAAKMDKQMKYANKRGFSYVIIAGESERQSGALTLKDFTTGVQNRVSVDEAIAALKAAQL